MYWPTVYWTALIAALISTLSLKFLHLFRFVPWSPVGWTDNLRFLTGQTWFVKWGLLLLILMVFYIVIYWLFTLAAAAPPSVTALVAALVIVCAAEWVIAPPDSFKSAYRTISIPFLSVAAIIMRFVSGTAEFMQSEMEEKAK